MQRLEPVGVATRDAAECIKVQLSALPSDTSSRDLALRIARDYLELVARHDREELRKRTGASDEALDEALDLIQSLEPRPGARYDNRRDEYLVPDVYVTRVDDEWRITLNPENDPGLKLNTYYIDLLRKSGGADADYLRGRMQEARWLMSSLELRNQTLMRVSQSIVEFQEEFLERGELAMKPLVLKDVSEAIGVHESTVSRATTRKYMLTTAGRFRTEVLSFPATCEPTVAAPSAPRRSRPGCRYCWKTNHRPAAERPGPLGIVTQHWNRRGPTDRRQVPGSPWHRFLLRAPTALPKHFRQPLIFASFNRMTYHTRQPLKSSIRLDYGLFNPSRFSETR